MFDSNPLNKKGLSQSVLCLGSNLGDKRFQLKQAIKLLESDKVRVIQSSSIYLTEPVDYPNQDWFFNQVLVVETQLLPHCLLTHCLQVEKSLSSKHRLPKGPRVIDVDILLYENQIVTDQKLTIPHPKFHLRRFALTPTAEIVGGIFHPVLGKSISNLLSHCKDRAEVVQDI